MANTFLAPPPRGVAALVSVSDDKIQITILILRRGALSNTAIFSERLEVGKAGSRMGSKEDRLEVGKVGSREAKSRKGWK